MLTFQLGTVQATVLGGDATLDTLLVTVVKASGTLGGHVVSAPERSVTFARTGVCELQLVNTLHRATVPHIRERPVLRDTALASTLHGASDVRQRIVTGDGQVLEHLDVIAQEVPDG